MKKRIEFDGKIGIDYEHGDIEIYAGNREIDKQLKEHFMPNESRTIKAHITIEWEEIE